MMTEPNLSAVVYDHVVVGSSPLMLMVAQRLCSEGRSVLVISRAGELGGNWRKFNIDRDISAEAACHLIEPIPSVYGLLEQYSGEIFVKQNPQPYRCLNTKRFLEYSGFFNRMLTYGALLISPLPAFFKYVFDRRDPTLDIKIAKAKTALVSTGEYLLGGMYVRVPKSGYAHFIDRLKARAVKAGAEFVEAEFQEVELQNSLLRLQCGDLKVSCFALEMTSSVCLRRDGPKLIPMRGKAVERTSVFVKVAAQYIRRQFSYLTFNGDSPLKRMCLLNVPGLDVRYYYILLELPPERVWAQSRDDVVNYLVRSGFLSECPIIDMLFERVENLAWSFSSSCYSRGNDSRVRYWDSRGNLADGIYRYRRFLKSGDI